MVDDNGSNQQSPKGGAGGSPKDATESLDVRRRQLETELEAHRKKHAPELVRKEAAGGYALAVKLSSEFIAGVLVGIGLGYLFDRFLGTSPWGMIFFLLLGFCAGVLNVLRSTGAVSTPQPGQRRTGEGQDKT